MILRVHVQGAPDYEIGDEIWQESLAEAIAARGGDDRRLRRVGPARVARSTASGRPT